MVVANCVLTAGGGSVISLVLGWCIDMLCRVIGCPLQDSILRTSNSRKAPAAARVDKLIIVCIFGHALEFVNADARLDGMLTVVNSDVIISPS